jgi:hypothetical protein
LGAFYLDFSDILLDKQRYSDESVRANSQDIILINPPFNPTFPGREDAVAYHASAGEIGMDIFEEWVQILPQHLNKSKGTVIGYQMSPVSDKGVKAIEKLRDALGDNSRVRYCKIIPDDFDTREFLTGQYQDYIKNNSEKENVKLTEWIEKMSKKYLKLSLVYFEAQITDEIEEAQITDEIELVWREHGKTWQDRIECHRMIVNNVDSQSVISLFQKGKGFQELRRFKQTHDIDSHRIIKDICEFIDKRKPEKLFDFICIDAAQILSGMGNLNENLSSHHIAWIHENNLPSSTEERAKIFQEVIEKRQSISVFGQISGLGYFLHPLYTGAINTCQNSRYISTTYTSSDGINFDSGINAPNSSELINRAILEFNETKHKQLNEGIKVKNVKSITDVNNFFFTTNNLDALKTPSVAKYYEIIENKKSYFHPALKALLEKNSIKTVNELIEKVGSDDNFAFETHKVLSSDIRQSHEILHSLIVQEFETIFNKKMKCLSYVALPLWLKTNIIEKKREDRVPDTYIGSGWILVGSAKSEKLAIEQENFLQELMVFVWTLLSDDYRWRVTQVSSEEERATTQAMIAHAIKNVTGTLEGKWISPIDFWIKQKKYKDNLLFDVKKVENSSLKEGSPIAKIEVNELWADKIAVSYYSPFIEIATKFIRLWCMQPTIDDCPFKDIPRSLDETIKGCWILSGKVCVIPHFISKEVTTTKDLMTLDKDFADVAELFKHMIVIRNDLSQSDCKSILGESTEISTSLNIQRILISIFINCHKYYEPSSPVNIHLFKDGNGIHMKIVNKLKMREYQTIQNKFIDSLLTSGNRVNLSKEAIHNWLIRIRQINQSLVKVKKTCATDDELKQICGKINWVYTPGKIANDEYICSFKIL